MVPWLSTSISAGWKFLPDEANQTFISAGSEPFMIQFLPNYCRIPLHSCHWQWLWQWRRQPGGSLESHPSSLSPSLWALLPRWVLWKWSIPGMLKGQKQNWADLSCVHGWQSLRQPGGSSGGIIAPRGLSRKGLALGEAGLCSWEVTESWKQPADRTSISWVASLSFKGIWETHLPVFRRQQSHFPLGIKHSTLSTW